MRERLLEKAVQHYSQQQRLFAAAADDDVAALHGATRCQLEVRASCC
jgi:hypothetical protein